MRTGWLWALALVLLALWILRRFFEPIGWASIVAVVMWPLYRRFAERLGASTSSSVAALLFTVLTAVFFFGPLAFAFAALVAEVGTVLARLPAIDQAGVALPVWLEGLPFAGDAVRELWYALLGRPGGISASLQRADGWALLGWAQSLGRFMERHAFIGFFTVFALFFAYRGGAGFAASLRRALGERIDPRAPRYADLAVRTVRATLGGMAVLALFDGVAAGILYALAGVPSPAVWGAITGLLAMIPFVGYVVIAGVALALLAQGAAWTALAVAVWGSLVVFVGDKVVRPLAVGHAVKLNLFWVLVGSLGGFEVLGLIGLFVGPVVLALCAELWREWVPQEQRLPHAPTEHGRFPDDPGRRGRYAESVSSSPRKRP